MPARGRVKLAEAFRVGADFAKQPLHFALKTHAEFRRNPGIITNRSGKFLVRLGMKQMIHSPAILRARARDSSSGTPSTFPDSISAIRRSVSVFHDSDVPRDHDAVNQFRYDLARQLAGFFDNLIKRHRHIGNGYTSRFRPQARVHAAETIEILCAFAPLR